MAKIRAKEPQILSAQIQIARKSLAEWPIWLRETPRVALDQQNGAQNKAPRLRPAAKR
jgi:hypothetical protein